MRDFNPCPDVALGKLKFNPEIHKTYYKYDYIWVENEINKERMDRWSTYRTMIQTDLWFIVYFVIGIPDNKRPNHPFVIARANEINESDNNYCLDIWAREHYKSSLKTIAKKIQRVLTDPESAEAIFSHKAPISKNFLFAIKQILEGSEILKRSFPDVLWENPQREAPRWSLDEGLVLIRKSSRPEATISAHGLTEGMPVGLHFDFMDFDDIVTRDIAKSIVVMEDVKENFEVAMNLGTDGGGHSVTGTIYAYNDPVVFVRDKVDKETGEKIYKLRQYTSTHNGAPYPSGRPVFNTEEREKQLRNTRSYPTQQLCDPSPVEDATLDSALLKEVKPSEIPKGCYRFIIVDQAGDADYNLGVGDDWAILTADVMPTLSSIGASDVYITDIFAEPLGAAEGIEIIVQKYIDAGFVKILGIEKAGMSVTHTQVREALKKLGKWLTIENDIKKKRSSAIVLLRPEKRNKKKFIDSAIEWPLSNGKIHISTDVPVRYREKLELEMQQHPYGKSDNILNTLAYLFKDIILQYQFPAGRSEYRQPALSSRGTWMSG